ncbi:anthranilate phosphoribosyltransferase [Staphylococcus massiliensis]|uniref:Anthranilate phosphoribosyltransferase n=1 Tax=Staphylococcus massiliensis S46 TaxID=1229783 RepID=K9ALZ8_9STAP|nr:anthranilate phosphoribosyltransferase [Staphylococcus massiliensis]EKU47091.1 anthranilate phosphoribosyltransferase [Staphylococcus massiliensis S46]MCG3412318.1 anthranilate phosphoribosyltransferase [Staphylococcus massiliensis]PNZ98528.1 anthranilate phosphoribosyltransferase [Staphylococcus massiliensis CCUG 55927]
MEILKKLMQFQNLTEAEVQWMVDFFLDENVDEQEKLHILIAFTMKRETTEELTALTKALIASMYQTQPTYNNAMCVCGTGGDRSNSFNISTTVSFVVAAAGVPIIKHGNRSITSKSGSVDLLEALKVETLSVQNATQDVDEKGISFLSATETYPVFKYIQPIRKRIPMPTVFNIVGPMINPFQLDYQVMGVYEPSKMSMIAKTIQTLGRKRAIVVHGANGMDEATLSGDNLIYEVTPNEIKQYTINAKDFGLNYADNASLIGGDVDVNKAITLRILNGTEQGPKRDVVLLNAGIALYVSEKAASIQEGVHQARKIIDKQFALKLYQQLGGVSV